MRASVTSSRSPQARKHADLALRILREDRDIEAREGVGAAVPDILIAIGDGPWLLDTVRSAPPASAVLCVGRGFLAEVAPESLPEAMRRLARGDHWVEERMRLEMRVEGKRPAWAINEAALTTSRGAGFVRYSVEIDHERVWRDGGDGVIVATPAGSTAYGLSAGGPIVMENADAIVIVPVCSSTGQRPLVVPRSVEISISGVESRLGCDAVLDGRERIRVGEAGFTLRASAEPLRLVRFGKARYLRVFQKLGSKRVGPPLPAEAPPSAKFVFHLLASQGPLTERQLVSESGLAERTVRSGLSWLLRAKRARRVTSLRDAREAIFSLEK